RGDIGMSQHLLDAAQIGAMVEQVAGKGMTQHMRRQPIGVEAGFDRQLLQQLAAALPRQMPDAAARREEPARRPRSGHKTLAAAKVGGKRQPAWLAQRHDAFPTSLARYQEK